MFKKEKQQSEKSTNKLRYIVYSFALLALLSGIVVNVVSKYVRTNNEHAAIQAQEFYFESDLLTEEGKVYELASETESVTIKLRNYTDKLRYSQGDIAIVFTVTENGNEVFSQTDTAYSSEQTWEGDFSFPVEHGKTYQVTATGTCGFKKVLTGTFNIAGEDTTLYKSVEQTNEYVELTVWTKDLSGVIDVTIPDGLIPDNKDDILKNVKTNDSVFTDTQNFQKTYSSYTYRFFKTNNTSYNEDSFEVTCRPVG